MGLVSVGISKHSLTAEPIITLFYYQRKNYFMFSQGNTKFAIDTLYLLYFEIIPFGPILLVPSCLDNIHIFYQRCIMHFKFYR